MAKFRIVCETVIHSAEELDENDEPILDYERETPDARRQMVALQGRWWSMGKYIRLDIDTEAGTCTVVR